MKSVRPDAAMTRAQKLFEKSGKTLEELGLAMGADEATAHRNMFVGAFGSGIAIRDDCQNGYDEGRSVGV